MGIYIKGMEMPKVCYDCDFCTYGFCSQIKRYVTDSYSREEDCPIIELPPHGRLIDADVLEDLVIKTKDHFAGLSANGEIGNLYKSWGLHDAELMIETIPTIVPAEGKEE